MILAFTGHRPEKLPWGFDETDPRCRALQAAIAGAVKAAAEDGAHTFLCGMARGCDLYFARAVLELQKTMPHIRLEAYLPCPSQADCWPEGDRAVWQALLLECSAVYMVEQVYTKGCMLRRNRVMIDRADALLTVWDGSPGGTAAAIRYARKTGKNVNGLWL